MTGICCRLETHAHTHSLLEEQSLSFSWSLHHNPPVMLRSEAGNPSCTVSGWRSAPLTPRRSGYIAVSTSPEHYPFQEHVGCMLLVVNKKGRADDVHVDGLGLPQCVVAVTAAAGVWKKKHPHREETFGRLSEFHCTVCSLSSAAGAMAHDNFVFETTGRIYETTWTQKTTWVHVHLCEVRKDTLTHIHTSPLILLFRSVSGSNCFPRWVKQVSIQFGDLRLLLFCSPQWQKNLSVGRAVTRTALFFFFFYF